MTKPKSKMGTVRRPKAAATLTPNPEAGLTEAEREVRRELIRSERPVTDAAIEIARLRARQPSA